MFILGISGKRGAGKDLLANILGYQGFKNHPFAGVLKERVRQDFGLSKEHTDGALKETPILKMPKVTSKPIGFGVTETKIEYWTPREIMIAYGQFYRQFDTMFWVKKVFEKIRTLSDQALVTISDVRFINEANYIKEQGGKLIRLERNPSLNIYKGVITDASECELDDYKGFDYTVPAERNETPQDLERVAEKVRNLVKEAERATKTL